MQPAAVSADNHQRIQAPGHCGRRVGGPEGFRPHRQQVGQTGARIAAEPYLAGGISGAIQHMVANREAHRGVSTDPGAPIIPMPTAQ